MKYWDSIYHTVNRPFYKGLKVAKNGATLICHTPQIAQEAWLHQLFKGLSNSELRAFEDLTGTEIPKIYRELLTEMNGAIFFSGALALHGIVKKISRVGDDVWQPFDIASLNSFEKPPDSSNDFFFFGSYNWDGSLLYVDLTSGFVYRSKRDSCKPLNKWKSLMSMLNEELGRLEELFDNNGNALDDKIPTIPINS